MDAFGLAADVIPFLQVGAIPAEVKVAIDKANQVATVFEGATASGDIVIILATGEVGEVDLISTGLDIYSVLPEAGAATSGIGLVYNLSTKGIYIKDIETNEVMIMTFK